MNNNKKYLTGLIYSVGAIGILIVGLFVLSLYSVANAATYNYVNTSGGISSVIANTSTEAINSVPNIALHSGVMLTSGSGNTSSGNTSAALSGPTQYGYVNDSGVFTRVYANTSAGAFSNSVDISEHSGVMILNSNSDIDMIGDNVSGF